MSFLDNIMLGLSVSASPTNLLVAFLGAVVGTIFGAFPGLSAPTAIALLLPLTFNMDPTTAIIMMAGIYYGTQYGGSITAVLMGIPGDASALMTAIEGHKLALKGKGGQALTVAAVGSFVAGIIGMILLAITGPALANFALRFGPPEYFSIIVLAMCALPAFVRGGYGKMLIALGLGLFLSMVGIDDFSGQPRFTFGTVDLLSGIPFVPAVIGLLGVSDIIHMAGRYPAGESRMRFIRLRELFLPWAEWMILKGAIFRASVLGFFMGVLPGTGATIASFIAYGIERVVSRDKASFGSGKIEGVAAAESANNSASVGAMVPLLTLGIPGSASTAVMLGGFMIWGLQPGPMLFQNNPTFVWGLVMSMLFGNVFLLVMNIALVPLFSRLVVVPYRVLSVIVIVFCVLGAYSNSNSVFDIWIMLIFAIIGYVMTINEIDVAPVILALVLGPLLESSIRQSLTISKNGYMVFIDRPICLAVLICAALLLLTPLIRSCICQLLTARGEAGR